MLTIFGVVLAAKIWLCLGRSWTGGGGNSSVSVVSAWQASPNTIVEVIPHIKFYAAMGSQERGAIVDVNMLSSKAVIEFQGGATTATVNYNDNGTWS